MQIPLAVALALASAVSYGVAAVLQHREASRHVAGGLELVRRVVSTRGWWLAMIATLCGATLHLLALAHGSLLLVQPLGISALVFALLFGALRFGMPTDRLAWTGAALTVVGLPAALSLVGGHPTHAAPPVGYPVAAGCVAALVAVTTGAAWVTGRRHVGPAAVLYAVAAAMAFGLTSATVKLLWLGHVGAVEVVAGLAAALAGIVLAQHAYRDGGLGAPLATLTLVDPLTAGTIGVLTLGEPLATSAFRLAVGGAGALLTVTGVVLLAPRRPVPEPAPALHPIARGTR